jgi:DNA polymerase elongation subunit (family B)
VLLERTDLPELLFPAANQLLSAPLVALSYDIESAAPGGGFPDAGRASDQIVCIGVQWGVVDRPEHDRSLVLCLDPAGVGWGTPPTGRFECFATERQLIERFACLAREIDPDLYTGYNLAGFDAQYVWRRGAMTGAEEALEQMGRLRRLPTELVQRTLQTSSGEVVCHDIRQLGRVTVDMYREIQTSYKLPSYTLQNVSEHLLGAGKHDIGDYTLIPVYASGADDTELGERAARDDRLAQVLRFMPPEAYARVVARVPAARRAAVLAHVSGGRYAGHRAAVAGLSSPDSDAGLRRRSELADYCRQDASLAMELMRKVGTVPALLAMSRVTHTSMHNLLSRGQQTKVFSMLYTGARARGLVMTTPPEVYCDVQGATVLEPIRGVHTLPIATLDFASLYPNCFRAANICYSTFVSLRDAHDPEPAVPAADRTDLWIDDRTIVSFVKPAVRAGLLPIIAAELMAARKATRAAQRAHRPGSVEHRNLENRQLALKISVNAIYGGLGVVDGNYSLHPAAAATTAVGRRALAVTQRLCRDEMQDLAGRVIYGDTDSVMVELRVDPVLWSEPPRPSESDPRRLHGTDGVREAFRVGTALEERLNSRIAQEFGCEFLVLEFEQLFNVSCFLSPKRYMGSRWVGTPELSVGLYLKGVQSERRDSSAPQREALRGTMAALMFSESHDPIDRVEGAVHALQAALQRFLDHDVPMDDYIMTKSLRDHYRVPNAKGPHLTILKKMRARAPGSEPQPGNRVPYIIIYDGSCGTRASTVSERAEDPDYALDHGRVPDRCFYANLMLNAMSDMLDPLLPVGQPVRVIARPYLDRMAAQDAGMASLSAAGPPALPLVRLPRETPTLRPSSQTRLGFLPIGRSERTHRPPSRPTKRVREKPHPKLSFKIQTAQ